MHLFKSDSRNYYAMCSALLLARAELRRYERLHAKTGKFAFVVSELKKKVEQAKANAAAARETTVPAAADSIDLDFAAREKRALLQEAA